MGNVREKDIKLMTIPDPVPGAANSGTVIIGRRFSPQQQILLYEPEEWEEFIHEWVHSQRSKYKDVLRMSGSGDEGIDIAGLVGDDGLNGEWDCFQCKHFKNPIASSKAMPEIAKILWYSYRGDYAPPRHYYFVAPQGCSTQLTALLKKPGATWDYLREHWKTQCADAISQGTTVKLTGGFLKHAEKFDFGIFSFRTALEIIDEHRFTPYFTSRFGGGLPPRPAVDIPPVHIHDSESRYINQLFEAYSDRTDQPITNIPALAPWTELTKHFHTQREYFYHAESLRNFARDTVPPGTFKELQEEVYEGVVGVASRSDHADALSRLDAVTDASTKVQITANGLLTVLKGKDRKGMCHQLANEERLQWRKP